MVPQVRNRALTQRVSIGVLFALLLTACGGSQDDRTFEGLEIEPTARPALVLTDTNGQTYDLAVEGAGKVSLVYFGYTNCPDICPIHLSQLTDVLDRPGMPQNVEVVFVTVDPSRDSAERLSEYLAGFSADFVGLTGTEEEVAAAQRAFGAIVALRESDDENYTMGHDGRVFAFTPEGTAYTQYPHPTRQSAWVHDLPILAAIDSSDGSAQGVQVSATQLGSGQ
jgi:protein SCO1/2